MSAPKLIKTEAEYQAALAEAWRLWEADPGTPDGDRVEALVVAIEAYEAEHFLNDGDDDQAQRSR